MKAPLSVDARELSATIIVRTGAAPSAFTLRIVEARIEALVGKTFHGRKMCVIGRVEGSDIVIPDGSVSRRHASVEPVPGGCLLKDLGSSNGTWIGDRRIQEMHIDHLDRFRVGTSVFELLLDDDMTGEALEMVRTTAVPVKAILQGIEAALEKPDSAGRLEDEGEEVLITGNSPFLLNDPGSAWIVEAGRIDIFTVAVRNGEPAGSRSHFVSVETTQAFLGMDALAYGIGSGFLASGRTGTRLRKISLARLRQLASEGKHVDRIVSLLEVWVSALARALVQDMPAGPSVDVELEEGRESILDFQGRARSRKGVAWVEVASRHFLFIGLAEIGTAPGSLLFPVTHDCWIEAAHDGVPLAPVPPAAALARPEFWLGLEDFHRVLCECEFINKRLATVDEFNRLKSKSENAEAAREQAFRDIGGVMEGSGGAKTAPDDAGDGDPVFQACRLVCRELGMEARRHPDPAAAAGFEDLLEAVSLSSRFRTRKVALRGNWWNEDGGPILAVVEETKEPVALLPAGPDGYDWVDPRTGTRRPVTRELAATLDPFGYVLYRRFRDGVLSAKDIVLFGARGLRRDLATLMAMGVALGLLGSITPFFTGQMFDRAILRAEQGLLFQVSAALFFSAIASSAFKLTESIAMLRMQGKMDYSIQAALWDRLLDLPSTFFRKYSSGDLADRAGGIDAIWQLLAGAGIGAVLGAMSSVFYIAMMLAYSVPLTLVGLLLTAVFIGFSTITSVLQLRVQREQLTLRGKLAGLVLQLIEGVGKLRVSGSEDHGFRVWARDFAEQRRMSFRIGRIQRVSSVFGSAFPIFASMAVFSVLISGQQSAGSGGRATGFSTGDFIAFSAAFGAFLAAMQALAGASLNLLAAVPIWERLTPILETPSEVDDAKTAPRQLRGAIEISHLSFRYSEESPYVLSDLSLKISAGEFIAFVGASGCGKSTLLRLMLGFEKPEKGSVYFDGQDLADLDVRLVRRQLGVVLQDSSLLPADIYRNIVGTSSRTIDEAWAAAEASGFADDIREMPMGMLTFVSEGGGGLSGGQRQRLMISRAIVNRPRILFLDEATSALDNRTQAVVTESLKKLRSTRVCIAHRLSTIIDADRIFYLERGTIQESGTYAELMKRKSLFYEMARRQQA